MAMLKKSVAPVKETPVETPVETEAGFTPPVEDHVVEEKQIIPQEAEPAGEVAVAEPKKFASMVSLKNAIEPGLFGHAANKVVAASGKLKIKPDDVFIGETMDAQVLSYNARWSVGPKDIPNGDQDAKFLFRSSYDGKTVNDNELGDVSIDEYVEKMIPEKYKGGEVKEYLDVIVAAIGCEDKKMEEDVLEKMLFLIQLSPSVTAKFNFFAGTAGMKALSGRMDPRHQTCMRFRGAPGPNKSFTYDIIKFESCPAEVLAGYEPIDASALVG